MKKSTGTFGKGYLGAHGQKDFTSKSHKKEREVFTQTGIVYNVGVGYLDLLQNDHRVVKILTNRIKNINWVDRNCNYGCFHGLNLDCNCRNRRNHCSKCQLNHQECRCHNHSNYCSHCQRDDRKCRCHNHREYCSDCKHHHSECHCDNQHEDCQCRHKPPRIQEHVIPFCDERIQLRLAGLTDDVNFKLFRHLGCKVVLELS